jgi:hypothetical protein
MNDYGPLFMISNNRFCYDYELFFNYLMLKGLAYLKLVISHDFILNSNSHELDFVMNKLFFQF